VLFILLPLMLFTYSGLLTRSDTHETCSRGHSTHSGPSLEYMPRFYCAVECPGSGRLFVLLSVPQLGELHDSV